MKKILIMMSILLVAGWGRCATILDPEDTAGEFSAWHIDDAVSGRPGGDSPLGGLSTPGDSLTISAPASGMTPKEDMIFDDGALAGGKDYSTLGVKSIRFDFTADANASADNTLMLFFYSDRGADPDRTWYYPLSVTPGGSQSYIVNLSLAGELGGDLWDNFQAEGAGTAGEFSASLADVDEIGVLINYHNLGAQVYGLDNFTLDDAFFIPEPGSLAMLGVALGSLGMALRRQRKEEGEDVAKTA